MGSSYRIVQEEHNCGEPPRPFLVPEYHLTNVANVTNLGMTEAEFPTDQGPVALIRWVGNIVGAEGLTYKAQTEK